MAKTVDFEKKQKVILSKCVVCCDSAAEVVCEEGRYFCECRNCGHHSAIRDNEDDAIKEWNEEGNVGRIRFTKIKYNPEKGSVFIAYQKGKDYTDEYTVKCTEKPRPEFIAAMKALTEHVVMICELPSEYAKRIQVKGVSLNYGGPNETKGATITAAMLLENSNAPLNINTPNKAFDMYNEDADPDPKVLMSDECIDAIEDLETEARKYIAGHRAQGNLFEAQKEVA